MGPFAWLSPERVSTMKRKLFFLAAALGISLSALSSAPPLSAAYPTCSNLYCASRPGTRCTCPGTVTYHTICDGYWQDGCPPF